MQDPTKGAWLFNFSVEFIARELVFLLRMELKEATVEQRLTPAEEGVHKDFYLWPVGGMVEFSTAQWLIPKKRHQSAVRRKVIQEMRRSGEGFMPVANVIFCEDDDLGAFVKVTFNEAEIDKVATAPLSRPIPTTTVS